MFSSKAHIKESSGYNKVVLEDHTKGFNLLTDNDLVTIWYNDVAVDIYKQNMPVNSNEEAYYELVAWVQERHMQLPCFIQYAEKGILIFQGAK